MAISASPSATVAAFCGECGAEFESGGQLESHICVDHLNYYPYGCMHCGHWLPTEEFVYFHAQKKGHLPAKELQIKENFDLGKENRLNMLMQQSTDRNSLPDSNLRMNDDGNSENFEIQNDAGDDKTSVMSMSPILNVLAGSARPSLETIGCNNACLSSGVSDRQTPSSNRDRRPGSAGTCSSSRNELSLAANGGSSKRRKPSNTEAIVDFANTNSVPCSTAIVKYRKLSRPGNGRRGRGDLSLFRLYKSMIARNGASNRSSTTARTSNVLPEAKSELKSRHLHCCDCGVHVLRASVAVHVFNAHMRDCPAIACPYCTYTVPYAVEQMKKHVARVHPEMPERVIDRRPQFQEVYFQLREKCFPELRQRGRLVQGFARSVEQQETDGKLPGVGNDADDDVSGNNDGSGVGEGEKTTE